MLRARTAPHLPQLHTPGPASCRTASSLIVFLGRPVSHAIRRGLATPPPTHHTFSLHFVFCAFCLFSPRLRVTWTTPAHRYNPLRASHLPMMITGRVVGLSKYSPGSGVGRTPTDILTIPAPEGAPPPTPVARFPRYQLRLCTPHFQANRSVPPLAYLLSYRRTLGGFRWQAPSPLSSSRCTAAFRRAGKSDYEHPTNQTVRATRPPVYQAATPRPQHHSFAHTTIFYTHFATHTHGMNKLPPHPHGAPGYLGWWALQTVPTGLCSSTYYVTFSGYLAFGLVSLQPLLCCVPTHTCIPGLLLPLITHY